MADSTQQDLVTEVINCIVHIKFVETGLLTSKIGEIKYLLSMPQKTFNFPNEKIRKELQNKKNLVEGSDEHQKIFKNHI